jgi:hypothetical protein
VAGEALPLVVVLWDLPASRSIEKAVAHEVNAAPAAPTVNMAPAAVQSPVVTFKLAFASQPNESMPVVQTAKITSSGTQSAVDSQTVSDFGQLSKALASALKDSAHTQIDALSVSVTTSDAGLTSGSVASALTHFPSDQPGGSKPVAATAATLSQLPAATPLTTETAKPTNSTSEAAKPTGSTVEAATPASQIAKLDQHSTVTPSPSPPHPTQDVSALVQDFFDHTPSWSQVGAGKQVVVYDTVALSSHPDEVKSVSFDFSDGSTLSLVGLPAALPHPLVG